MAISPYTTPARQELINTFVPIDYKQIGNALSEVDKQHEELTGTLDLLGDKKVNYLKADAEKAQSLNNLVLSQIDDITSKTGGDLRKAVGDIKALKRRVTNTFDKQGGEGYAVQEAFNTRKKIDEQLKADKTISAQSKEMYLKAFDKSYKGVSKDDYGQYQGEYGNKQLASDYNLNEKVLTITKMVEPDVLRNAEIKNGKLIPINGWKQTGQVGQVAIWRKGDQTIEVTNPDKVAAALEGIKQEPLYQSYVDRQNFFNDQLGTGYNAEEEFNNAIKVAQNIHGTKYIYNEDQQLHNIPEPKQQTNGLSGGLMEFLTGGLQKTRDIALSKGVEFNAKEGYTKNSVQNNIIKSADIEAKRTIGNMNDYLWTGSLKKYYPTAYRAMISQLGADPSKYTLAEINQIVPILSKNLGYEGSSVGGPKPIDLFNKIEQNINKYRTKVEENYKTNIGVTTPLYNVNTSGIYDIPGVGKQFSKELRAERESREAGLDEAFSQLPATDLIVNTKEGKPFNMSDSETLKDFIGDNKNNIEFGYSNGTVVFKGKNKNGVEFNGAIDPSKKDIITNTISQIGGKPFLDFMASDDTTPGTIANTFIQNHPNGYIKYDGKRYVGNYIDNNNQLRSLDLSKLAVQTVHGKLLNQ